MKTALQMFIVLTSISLISGALLAGFDSYTARRIQEHRLKALKQAITEVLPKHDYYKEIQVGQYTIYEGMPESGDKPVALAFRLIGNGFQGKIAMMIGIQPDFSHLTGIKILEQLETPGLGTKIEFDPSRPAQTDWFTEQFKGILAWPQIDLVKNQKPKENNEIQAITGATISSKAIVRILNEQIGLYRMIYLKAQQ